MSPPNIIYSSILMASGVACLIVAVIVWNMRRGATGAASLVVFLLALSWWDITYSIFWIDFPGPSPYFWLDMTMAGAFTVPTAFFVFSLEHARLHKWLTRPILIALLTEPILAFLMLWTDPWHNLFFGGKRALNTTMILDAGMVHWANIYYSYILIIVGIVIQCVALYRSVGVYRKQTALTLMAIIIPVTVHVGFMFTGDILPNADATPFIFSITAVVTAAALLRYHLMDIVPIARTMLIENMSEGVIVLDTQNRILDINPSAARVTKLPASASIGKSVEKVFSTRMDIINRYQDVEQARVEVALDNVHLDMHISPLLNDRAQFIGRLVVWRDITELKIAQAKLEKLATTDGLTGVLNRRSFLARAHAEYNRALRLNNTLSIALMDIDHFKNINDSHGHPAGDKVLVDFAKLCTEKTRDFEVFARFGGEEFALLMPETDDDQAFQACERIRQDVSQSLVDLGGKSISITVSLGVASLKSEHDTLDQIIQRADQALYHAKQSGKNQSVVWQASFKP